MGNKEQGNVRETLHVDGLDGLKDLIRCIIREEFSVAEQCYSEEDELRASLSQEGKCLLRLLEIQADQREEQRRRDSLSEEDRLIEDLCSDEVGQKMVKLLRLRKKEADERRESLQAGLWKYGAPVITTILSVFLSKKL